MQARQFDVHLRAASRNHTLNPLRRQVERQVLLQALRREAGEGRLRDTEKGGGHILGLRSRCLATCACMFRPRI